MREMVGEGRHVVLRHRETGEFIDDFTSKGKREGTLSSVPCLIEIVWVGGWGQRDG